MPKGTVMLIVMKVTTDEEVKVKITVKMQLEGTKASR